MVARYSLADYKAALLSLLPVGRVWSRDPAGAQAQLMDGLAPTFVRLDARAQALLVDAFPASTVELLGEWEQSLGLPDPCEGEDQTLQQRRAQVVTRLVAAGGQSVSYFLQVIERLGYEGATIEEFTPFKADVGVADAPVYDESWAHAWRITVPGLRFYEFSADISAADEALLTIANDVVICVVNQLKPAHTTVIYVAA